MSSTMTSMLRLVKLQSSLNFTKKRITSQGVQVAGMDTPCSMYAILFRTLMLVGSTTLPSSCTLPVILSHEEFFPTRPVSILSRLVLPLPDGPIMAVSDRGAKDNVNPARMTLAGFFFVAFVARRTLSKLRQ